MHVLYERLYQDQKTQIETIQELHNKTGQSLKEDILFLRNEVETRNELIKSIIINSSRKENSDHCISKTHPDNQEKDGKNSKQSTDYMKRKINKVSSTQKEKIER